MFEIRVHADPNRPNNYKTYGHKLAKTANNRWQTCVSKGLRTEAVSPTGEIVMKFDGKQCWKRSSHLVMSTK